VITAQFLLGSYDGSGVWESLEILCMFRFGHVVSDIQGFNMIKMFSCLGILGLHVLDEIDNTVTISNFIIVPGDKFDKCW